jgi:hypothetical protein
MPQDVTISDEQARHTRVYQAAKGQAGLVWCVVMRSRLLTTNGKNPGLQALAHVFALWMNEGNVMASDRCRCVQRLEQHLEAAEHPWLASRGLASLLAWDKAHPQPDTDPLAGSLNLSDFVAARSGPTT